MGATAASALTTGAWGGDPARKQASIAAARAALAAGPFVVCAPRLFLTDENRDWGNVYCTAYRTTDPAELEARAGLPVSALMLASAALSSCDYYVLADDGMRRRKRLAENALEAPIAALEAIPVGTDTIALGRSYVVELLGRLERLRDLDGRGLTPEQRALPRRLATLHGEGNADPVAFRALRRTATAATDAASVEIEAAVMAFVESLAWPLAGLTAELPDILQRGHQGLRAALAPERPTPVETAQMKAVDAMFDAVVERRRTEPALDTEPEVARIQGTPEFAAVTDLAFQVRLERLRDLDGRGLTPEQRALPRRLATLHGEGSADPVAFRALRRTATAATDAATAEIEAAIMAFVESLAWPLAGLIDELPDIVQRGHQGLRAALAPERPTPVETAQMKAVDAMCDALDERRRAEPGFDTEPEVDRIQATPEFLAVIDLAFQVRLEHYDHLAAEAYAPFAIDLLLGAFRKA